MNRSCLGRCGRTIPKGSRCPPCETARKGTSTERGYTPEWNRLSRQRRAEHVAANGLMCEGWGDHAPHEVASISDLCLDHDGPILCRSMNGRKGAIYDRNSPAPKGGDRPVPEFQ